MTTVSVRDARLAAFEAKFEEWNLAYEFVPEIRLADIRVADWAQVRAGINVAPKEQVEEYAEQMRNGAQFPPLILMKAGPPVLIDGNTRLAAARVLRLKSFPAYIVDTGTVEMAKILAGSVNQMGGNRLKAEEAQELALLMLARDMAPEAVAREVGRSATKVREWKKVKEAEEHASRLTIAEQFNRLDYRSKIRLADIVHDLPFAEAVALVAEVKPTAAQVKDMVEDVKRAPSDTVAVDLVRGVRAELRPAGPPPHRPNVNRDANLAHASIGNLLRLKDNPIAMLDIAKREEELARWQTLAALAAAVLDVLGVENAA